MRGTAKLALKNYEEAKADYDQAIKLDSLYVLAIYSRATLLVNWSKYDEALIDLNKAIDLKFKRPQAYTMRGLLLARKGYRVDGCRDLVKAKEEGDDKAQTYIDIYCNKEIQYVESIQLEWSRFANWKLNSTNSTPLQEFADYLHPDETLENWTEYGVMSTMKGKIGISIDSSMNIIYTESKKLSAKTKLVFIEKGSKKGFPWIIFLLESPNYPENNPESALCYLVQGSESLYFNLISIKSKYIPKSKQKKWSAFFKTAEIVRKN